MQSDLNFSKATFILLILAYLSGCKPEEFITDSNAKLRFSNDTILFDTILSQIKQGTPKSVNRQFLVINPHDSKIKATIFLGGGDKSIFRLNVDGDPGIRFENIEIRAHDSIFLFVEAYANPNNNSVANPLIIRDSVVFITNGNLQNVQILAWGQDAIYHFADSTETDLVWANKTKPYVIYDYFYVKPGATLTIKEGVKVYFSPYSTLYTEGTLKIEGTTNEPVIFEGDRTSDKYSDKFSAVQYYNLPGQWYGLIYGWPSKGNVIKNARIKNAVWGVRVDSSSSDGQATVNISNTFIQNMSSNAVIGTRANFRIENSVLANCGSSCLYTYKGGDYDLRHCTISGYCDFGGTTNPALAVTNRLRDQFYNILETYPLRFTILNSVVWGPKENEFLTDIDNTKLFVWVPINNVIKCKTINFNQPGFKNYMNKDPKFRDFATYNFEMDTLSSAKDSGLILTPPISTDFKGILRDNRPDIGAYERKE